MKISSAHTLTPDLLMRNRLYYHVKPFLPWRLRIGMRRIVARRTRELCKNTWPINESAGIKPEGWNGWPDDKKFALVLTHDVESLSGLMKCVDVMQLERELGFRSSFNFIPEGEYKVPGKLREELFENGFEVGVHDLRHDGKLYWRADQFSKNARSINRYLKDWNASGFRSAFMLRDRDCLRELDIQYDASTFDTDPFEPQPDGANTIFPFWVSDGNGGGYVELPYTLPQDSTLFLVLDEKSPDIWMRKLDWIVAHGGMVLLDVHPDYLGFGENPDISEYPAKHYRDFLLYVKTRYGGQYWNALPREVAAWFKETHRAQTPAKYVAEIESRPRRAPVESAAPSLDFEFSKIFLDSIRGVWRKREKFDFVDFAAQCLDVFLTIWAIGKKSAFKSAISGKRAVAKGQKFWRNLFQHILPDFRRKVENKLRRADRKTSVAIQKSVRQAVASATVAKIVARKNWRSSWIYIARKTDVIDRVSNQFAVRCRDAVTDNWKSFRSRLSTMEVPRLESPKIKMEAARPVIPPVEEVPREKSPLENVKVAVVLYSYYLSDPRPRREAEALRNAGAKVDVICLRKNKSEPAREERDGIRIFRVPLKRRRGGKLTYILQYGRFWLSAFSWLTLRSLVNRYKIVHVHNMPDFLVFTALVPRMLGAKVILDLHDPMPELFRTIYSLPEKHFVVRGLKTFEKWSIGFAHLALTPNLAFKELFTARSCRPGKVQTVMNSPDTTIFNPKKFAVRKFNGEKPFTLMYHGLLVERHGLDVAIRAVMRLRRRIPNIKLNMYGERTEYLERIMEHVWRTSMERHIEFHGYLPLPEIADNIMNIDLGIIPNRLSAFTEINFPTRIFEYLAMNKPVIVPSTLGIRDYFNDDDILYFQPDNPDDLAKKIEWAWAHPEELRQVLERGQKIYEKNCWDVEKEKFSEMASHLAQPDCVRAKTAEAKKTFA